MPFTPSSRLRFDDLEAMAEAATTGMGLASLPSWLVRDRLRSGSLIALFDGPPGAPTECHALWPAAQRMPLRLRLAIDRLPALVES